MPELVPIPISDLLLDDRNPRLLEEGDGLNQQQLALSLASKQGIGNVLRLAEDIVRYGLDPLMLTAVVATGDRRKRYRVLEGNRRLLALRVLETPALVSPLLKSAQSKKLNQLSAEYADDPVGGVPCVLFEDERAADHWIELRHTGQNEGVGLVGWGANEADSFRSRVRGQRKPAGQVVDFVNKMGLLSPEATTSRKGVLTNVERLVGTPYFRKKVGIELIDGKVYSVFPAEQVAKSLTKVIEDLKTGGLKVSQLYEVDDRKKYTDDLPKSVLPKKKGRLSEALLLEDLADGKKAPRTVASPAAKNRRTTPRTRTTVIPKSTKLDIDPPRVNAVFSELLDLNVERSPNAASVLFRVFVELSVDHKIEVLKLMTDNQRRNTPLAKRIKVIVDHLHDAGRLTASHKKAIEMLVDGTSMLAPGMATFNQYVHNPHSFPKPSEIYVAWDELAKFMEELWR